MPSRMATIARTPLCALDMYTQLGKIAVRRLFQSPDVLQNFSLQHVPRANRKPSIKLAMFQTKAALLDGYLSSPEIDELTHISEES